MTHLHDLRSPEMHACIRACLACAQLCTETVTHCLLRGGAHAEANHIATLLSCAEICQVSANAMLRGSHTHLSTCRACSEICKACAASCDTITDDEVLKRCADECRKCCESTAAMSRVT